MEKHSRNAGHDFRDFQDEDIWGETQRALDLYNRIIRSRIDGKTRTGAFLGTIDVVVKWYSNHPETQCAIMNAVTDEALVICGYDIQPNARRRLLAEALSEDGALRMEIDNYLGIFARVVEALHIVANLVD